jgi:hypothetical protein
VENVHDWLYSYYCGAGSGARSKYRAISKQWRKRVFRRPWLVYAGLVGPIVIAAFVERDNLLVLAIGVTLGGLLGGVMAIMESPPANVERWRSGYEGEQRTARVLAPLRREGYALLHDLADRRAAGRDYKGNVDHVIVSAAGVFLLDSKWLGGEASISGDTVHVKRYDDDEDSYDLKWSAQGVRAQAARLQRSIEEETSVRFVKAVMVFWNKFDAEVIEGQRIVFVHGDRLLTWLEEQPQAMSSEWVADVAGCIKRTRQPAHPAWWSRGLNHSLQAWATRPAHVVGGEPPLS